MMNKKINIKGIGTDIIEIDRLKQAYSRKKEAFLDKLFTDKEKKYCFKFKDFIPHFAARFAAKEAVVKAIGLGFGKYITFKDIEIINDLNGKPEVKLSSELKNRFEFTDISISISHSENYAIAFCLIQ